MRIEEADPVTKGQTASSSYKPARLENGVRVMVPPHVESGTRIVVNTTDNELRRTREGLRRRSGHGDPLRHSSM